VRFILLGTGSGMPELGTHQSALYVQVGDKQLLFDCGEGTSYQLLKHGLAGETLDAIFISHYHPDHVSGLFMVLQMLYIQKRQRPLQLFLPERPAVMVEILQYMYTFPTNFPFQLQILDCHEADLYHEEVSTALSDHLRVFYEEQIQAGKLPNQMNSYSFKISDTEGSLAYTADIATTDSVLNLLRDTHTVIVDGIHPDAAQVLKLQYAGITRILLNHGRSAGLLEACQAGLPDMFVPAQEDHVYSIPE